MNIIQVGAKVGKEPGIGKGNAGDTAIGTAFEYLFSKEFPNNKTTFMNSRKIFSIEDVNVINNADVLYVSGGGLFLHDTFKNKVSDWQWGISQDLLKKIKIPIVVYSVGYNQFRNQRNFSKKFNDTVDTLVEQSLFFSLRNNGSCNAIKKHTKKKNFNKIHSNFCPTMMLNKKYNLKHNFKSKDIGFVLAGDRLQNRHKNLENFVKHIKYFVSYLKKQGITTVLVNHQNDTWIKKYVKFDKYIDLFAKDTKKIYQTYSNLDFVVCDRGHAQMIPLVCGCKILSPVSHNKLKWFLKDMDLSEYGIEENDSNLSSKLIEKFEKLCKLDWKNEFEKRIQIVSSTNNKNNFIIKEKLEQLQIL